MCSSTSPKPLRLPLADPNSNSSRADCERLPICDFDLEQLPEHSFLEDDKGCHEVPSSSAGRESPSSLLGLIYRFSNAFACWVSCRLLPFLFGRRAKYFLHHPAATRKTSHLSLLELDDMSSNSGSAPPRQKPRQCQTKQRKVNFRIPSFDQRPSSGEQSPVPSSSSKPRTMRRMNLHRGSASRDRSPKPPRRAISKDKSAAYPMI